MTHTSGNTLLHVQEKKQVEHKGVTKDHKGMLITEYDKIVHSDHDHGIKWQKPHDSDNENAITVTQASNMAWHLQHFVMTKTDLLNCVLDSTAILQEFTKILISK